jgi:hypothetical protein
VKISGYLLYKHLWTPNEWSLCQEFPFTSETLQIKFSELLIGQDALNCFRGCPGFLLSSRLK